MTCGAIPFRRWKASQKKIMRRETKASLEARRMMAEKVIVFLATTSSAGSSTYTELKKSCAFIIHDEVAFSLEIETLVLVVSTYLNSFQ